MSILNRVLAQERDVILTTRLTEQPMLTKTHMMRVQMYLALSIQISLEETFLLCLRESTRSQLFHGN